MKLRIEQQYLLAGALLLIFVLLTIPVNLMIRSSSNYVKKDKTSIDVDELYFSPFEIDIEKKKKVNLLIPENPGKYNIVVQKDNDVPKNQVEWDYNMKRLLFESKVLREMKRNKAFKGIKMSKAAYEAKNKRIDEQIEELEGLLNSGPEDHDGISDRLQSLYMLKSTLAVLKNEILIKKKKL